MAYRRPARWFAPLALLGAIGAILLTISSTHSHSSSSDTGAAPAATTGATQTGTTSGPASHGHATARYYVVHSGDVLSGIAAATNVPLSRIEQLNPSVDAQSLHAGQKIKLAP